MQTDIQKILGYFNLSDGEVITYLTLLELGRGTAYEIAKYAGLKRPTVYVFTQNLAEKGLVTTRCLQAKTVCYPVAPQRLIDIWKGRVEALEAIKPQLDLVYRQNNSQPKVQIFEGQAGLDAVYNQLPPKNSQGDEILLFGSMNAVLDGFSYLIPKWEVAFENKKNPIRELINDDDASHDYLKKRLTFKNPHYQIRLMAGEPFGKTDNIIWQNKLAIFSLKKELFVTLIESQEIVKTYTALFDAAWQSATVIK